MKNKEFREKEEIIKCLDCGKPIPKCKCNEFDEDDVEDDILEDDYGDGDNQFDII